MIARHHRFHGHNSLSFVYRNGSTIRDRIITVRYILNRRRTEYRAAVIVSRKVLKSAVLRNRARRRIYEAIRMCEVSITLPYDVVVTVFNEAILEMSAEELHHLIKKLLAKAGVFSTESKAGHSSHAIVNPRGRSV